MYQTIAVLTGNGNPLRYRPMGRCPNIKLVEQSNHPDAGCTILEKALRAGVFSIFGERWLSGRKRRSRKPVYGQLYRGFESHSLRQNRYAIDSFQEGQENPAGGHHPKCPRNVHGCFSGLANRNNEAPPFSWRGLTFFDVSRWLLSSESNWRLTIHSHRDKNNLVPDRD